MSTNFILALLAATGACAPPKPGGLWSTQATSLVSPVQEEIHPGRGSIFLSFNIDGKEWKFFLDSGSPVSYVNPSIFKKLSNKERVALDLKIGKVTVAHVNGVTWGMPPFLEKMPGVGGLLGLDFLDQVIFAADAKHEKAFFWPSSSGTAEEAAKYLDSLNTPAEQGEPDERAKWHFQATKSDVDGRPLVPGTVGSTAVALALDTGTDFTSISVRALKDVRKWPLCSTEALAYGIPAETTFYVVPWFRTSFLDEGVTSVCSMPPLYKLDGILGMDRLSKGRWILDQRHNAFAFRPYDYDEFFEISTPIISFLWSEGYLTATLNPDFFERLGPEETIDSINGKDPHEVLSFPTSPLLTDTDFNLFGLQLRELFSKPFTLRLKEGSSSKEYKVDPSKGLR